MNHPIGSDELDHTGAFFQRACGAATGLRSLPPLSVGSQQWRMQVVTRGLDVCMWCA
jgi:hypothetical protein